ncbi:MAG: hypothetical protein LC667_19180 [Thioalkalivibrio sp.]|nr:hypothetical protein [Thioalkalivibrio sp.]
MWRQIIARDGSLPAVLVAGAPLTRPGAAEGEADVPVVVIRLDATVIEASSSKEGAEPNFKGCSLHPLTGWCSNTTENLVVKQRVGSAGSFTAADHIEVLDAAISQSPRITAGICW